MDGRKSRIGTVLFGHRKQGLSLSVHVDDIKNEWTKAEGAPMWKTWMEFVHLDERTSFPDHVYVGRDIINRYR